MPWTDFLSVISLDHYLILSGLLFTIGMAGVLLRKNTIVILMSIELMLNAVNLTFISFSRFSTNLDGHVMAFFVMTVAAAEAGVGLALAVSIFKRFRSINISLFENLKG